MTAWTLDNFVDRELNIRDSWDFYDYFETLLGVCNPLRESFIADDLLERDRDISGMRKTGIDDPKVLGAKKTKYAVVVHQAMSRVRTAINDLNLHHLDHLLESPTSFVKTDGVIAAARKRDENPAFYNELQREATAARTNVATELHRSLTAKFKEKDYQTFAEFQRDERLYGRAVVVLGYQKDENLLKSAKTKAISSEIEFITRIGPAQSDFEPRYVEVPREQRIECTHEMLIYSTAEKRGTVNTPLNRILDLLVHTLRKDPDSKVLLVDIPSATLDNVARYMSKLPGNLGEYVTSNRQQMYGALRKTLELSGLQS